MADDELLLACEAAPRFGLNAKAIILKAAAESDDEALPPLQSAADETREKEKEYISRAAEFLKAVIPELRPMMKYNPRSKFPQSLRQRLMDRLAGQHLALAALWAGALEPSAAAALDKLRDQAFQWARDQELELFRRCNTVGAYQTHLPRISAQAWGPAIEGRAALLREFQPAIVEVDSSRPTKRSRPLLSKGIDWEAAVPASEKGTTVRDGNESRKEEEDDQDARANDAVKTGTSTTLLSGGGDTAETDDVSDVTNRNLLDDAVRRQLETLGDHGWVLSDMVVCEIAVRCAAKVLRGREDASVEQLLIEEGSKIRKLVWQEAQVSLARAFRKADGGGRDEQPGLPKQ